MPAVTTDRLVLEPIDTARAAAIVGGDLTTVEPGTGWPQDDTVDGLRMEIERGGSPACWLIVRSGVVIGELGWKGGPGPDGTVEIGYGVAPRYRGHGYATEAVTGFVGWVRGRHDVQSVVAETLADNLASRRVLEKCGFTVTEAIDAYVYWSCETAS